MIHLDFKKIHEKIDDFMYAFGQKISAFEFLLPLWVLLVAQNDHPRLRNCPPFALQIDHQNRQSTVSPSIPPLLVKNPIRVKAEQSR